MRIKIINFLKQSPLVLQMFWWIAKVVLQICGMFCRVDSKTIMFASFGGRKFDDSPKALYDEICSRKEFDDYRLIWAFVDPDQFVLPRGESVKIDTISFFKLLLVSGIWISNSGITRGIKLRRKNVIRIETWHGTPLKKICGEENQNTMGGKVSHRGPVDCETIRCAQSEYDREIFARVFHAAPDSFLLCDLPRNDVLLSYQEEDRVQIKRKLNLPEDKKVILYMPTYREYLIENGDMYIAPPLDLEKWKQRLGNEYVLLVRAHYAVSKALDLSENDFVRDVSNYPVVSELYYIADMLISDYSSAFVDFSILERPVFCFAYDKDEYEEKRGLYIDLTEEIPCPVCGDEEELLHLIENIDEKKSSNKTRMFKNKYAPYAGSAAKRIIDVLEKKL